MECQNLTLAAGEWVYIPPTTKTSRWNRNPQLCALPKTSRYRAIIEPTQPGRSDRSVVAGQTVHGSVRPPSARSDRLRLWRLCIATKNQTSATDQWGRSDRPCHAVKRRYLLTRVSEFGVLGLYGKLIQRAIQPMKNPSKKHNLSQG
uniref:Uncharacterized protein n=1 Tax=Oryza sativa subsp. japonica TaxID=39947 RepID=Q6Z7R5_ORYSJ|nr:hypothetical protein [Oryza sativa Japonica Group]BAD15773.1 hypothetical protein [Oryza sativa Japonica Group]